VSPDQQECPLLDLAVAVLDPVVTSSQYRFIETHAWWLGTFGLHQYLSEQRLRRWVPAHPQRDWLLERELTGAHTWLTGSAAAARADGFDLREVVPTGRFRAPYGEFDERGHRDVGRCATRRHPPRGSWQSPTVPFFQRLPRDPGVLLERLCEDNPGSWFTPFAAAVTALRTGLVPAPLRAALYRAVTGLPDVQVAEHVPNVDGQDCLALVHDAGRTRTELLIDPVNGQFAGERDTLRADSRSGLRAGMVISATAVRAAVVDQAGMRP
jgi:hypothetical protein